MKSVQKYGLMICMAIVMIACDVERPEHILSDSVMEKVLYDYHIAKAMGEELNYRENYKRTLYIDAVFKKHNITEAQFDSTMAWYARYPEVINKVYDNIRERLKTDREHYNNLVAMRDGKPKVSKEGDSIDVWIWDRVHLLTGMPLDNKLSFTLPSDVNFRGNDTLKWVVGINFLDTIPEDSVNHPMMAMQVSYSKDTILHAISRIDTTQLAKLTLFADTLGDIKEISGFIYYPNKRVKQALLIDTISLMRYHANNDSIPSTQPEKTTTSANKENNQNVMPELVLPNNNERAIRPTEIKPSNLRK